MLKLIYKNNRRNPDPILASRTEATVVLAEFGITDNPWSDELNAVVHHCQRQKQGLRMVIWGTQDAIQKVQHVLLSDLMSVGGLLQGYKTRTILVHLSKDDPLPFRLGYCNNVTRSVLLLSPTGFKKGMDFMVTHLSWSPSLIVHLVSLLDIHRDVLTMLYVVIKCHICGLFDI